MEFTWLTIIVSLFMGIGAVLVFIFAVKKDYFRNLEDAKYQVFFRALLDQLSSQHKRDNHCGRVEI